MPSITLPGGRGGRNQGRGGRNAPVAPAPVYPEAWRNAGIPEPPLPPSNPFPVPQVRPWYGESPDGRTNWTQPPMGQGYGKPSGMQQWSSLPSSGMGGGKKGGGGGDYGGGNTNMPTLPGGGNQPSAWEMRNWYRPDLQGGLGNQPPSPGGTDGGMQQQQQGWGGGQGDLWQLISRLLMPGLAQ